MYTNKTKKGYYTTTLNPQWLGPQMTNRIDKSTKHMHTHTWHSVYHKKIKIKIKINQLIK